MAAILSSHANHNPVGALLGGHADESLSFKNDLKILLREVLRGSGSSTGAIMKHLYSPIVPPNCTESGADLWNNVINLGSEAYYIPQAEGRIVSRGQYYLSQLFADRPTVVDLGPGSSYAIETKSIPTIKAVNAKSYIALDINSAFAESAAYLVKNRRPGIITQAFHTDFTLPRKLNADSPILMTMYGCTLGQFSLKSDGPLEESSFTKTLRNLGNMVGHNAILIATIDTNRYGPSAKSCYTGEYTDSFSRQLWLTAKTIIEMSDNVQENYFNVGGDPHANPADAVHYAPRYDQERNGIVHSYMIRKEFDLMIDGEHFLLPVGTQIDAGFSERWDVEDLKAPAKEAGWSVANVLSDGQRSVQAVVFAGKKVSKQQLARARGKLTLAANNSNTPGEAQSVKRSFSPRFGGLSSAAIG